MECIIHTSMTLNYHLHWYHCTQTTIGSCSDYFNNPLTCLYFNLEAMFDCMLENNWNNGGLDKIGADFSLMKLDIGM